MTLRPRALVPPTLPAFSALRVLPLLLLLALALVATPVHAETAPGDKGALLAFKAAVVDDGGLLSSWDNSTDPCSDQWTGVLCTCLSDYEDANGDAIPSCTPQDPGFGGAASRVLQLNLGDVRITNWNKLGGPLPPSLGKLTALRVLNLRNNNFTGEMPWEWFPLVNLEQLVLAGNNINGQLPIYLARFSRLKHVYLDNNALTGPLPEDWCYGAWWPFDVRNNPGLCDEIPGCLYDRLASFDGTSLVDPISDRDHEMGGYCGVTPPTCRRYEDACWVQVPDPPFWQDSTKATFSFPDFPSTEGGPTATYEWCVGTAPGAGDVAHWQPFTGRNVTQTAEVHSALDGTATVLTQVVHLADGWLPPGVALRQGGVYYVTVRGSNGAGPLHAVSVTSDAVTVDATPPTLPAGSAVYSTQYFSNALAQIDTAGIGVSWDAFEDPESGVKAYAYQVFEYVDAKQNGNTDGDGKGSPDYAGAAQTSKVKVKGTDTRDVYVTKLSLQAGKSYFVRVYATNGAGAEGYHDGPPVAVMMPGEAVIVNQNTYGLTVSKVVVIVAALVGATSAAVAVLTFYFARERYRRRQQESRKYRGQMRNLRHLLNSLEREGGGAGGKAGDPLAELRAMRDVAFVITDLEGSTKIAAAAPRAYEWVQEAHDALLRDLISSHGGYEINTEGDAFHVAFKDVATAVHFCMEVQYQMMEVEWPREVLKLPECREVRAPAEVGGWAFRGPRLRMGIHWAEEGSVVQHIHALTKHRVFTGPAFQVTRELCEAGSGGQVLLSHDAWRRLRGQMPAAAFPVVEQLGCYKFPALPEPLWVYQVTRLMGKPLHRPPAPALQGCVRSEEGAGLSVVGAPVPLTTRGDLAFVSCRLAAETCPGGDAVPEAVHSRLFSVLAASAMQYQGFIFRMSESQGCYLVAFAATADALRFCHTAQVLLMYSPWPAAECGDWCGEEEAAADGKALFKGPRVAMAVHLSSDYSTRPVPRPAAAPDADVGVRGSHFFADYLGPAEEIARVLSEVAHGGQVVLSEPAWKAVQDQLPGGPQVISLGVQALEDPALSGPAMLMEVMPQVLAKRVFPPPRRARMVEPGYRDAPSASGDVAIAQMRVVKPAAVVAAEAAGAGLTDDAIIRIVTAYNVALARTVAAARTLLRVHGGYECKEPEPGKLTVAFRSLDAAVRWAAALQAGLLDVHWPREVLTWEECREVREAEEETLGVDVVLPGLDGAGSIAAPVQAFPVAFGPEDSLEGGTVLVSVPRDEEDEAQSVLVGAGGDAASVAASGASAPGGPVVWRGLRVRIGIACGVPTSKAPLNTGRADYFGTIPNLAARLMGLAAGGQTLVDGARVATLRPVTWRDEVGVLAGNEGFPQGVELVPLGLFAIKGLDEPRPVFQAAPMSLCSRGFAESPALVRPNAASMSVARRIHSLRMASASKMDAAAALGGSDSAGAAPSPRARRPGIFSSISRSGSVSAHTHPAAFLSSTSRRFSGSLSGATLSPLQRSTSRFSDTSDGTPALPIPTAGAAPHHHRNHSSTSSGGGGGGGGSGASWMKSWLGVPRGVRRSVASGVTSGSTTPKSPTGGGPFVAVTIPPPSAPIAASRPGGPGASSAAPSSYQSDYAVLAAPPAVLPVGSGHSMLAQRTLREVADWSCPGSRLDTPDGAAAASGVDAWDAGLAMEAALKTDGLDLPLPSAPVGGSAAGPSPLAGHNDPLAPVDGFGSLIFEKESVGGTRTPPRWGSPSRRSSREPSPTKTVMSPRTGLTIVTPRASEDMTDGAAAAAESKGLAFAQQVAQLFVDRRRKSVDRRAAAAAAAAAEEAAARSSAPGATSPSKKPSSWALVGKLLGGKGDVPSSEEAPLRRTSFS